LAGGALLLASGGIFIGEVRTNQQRKSLRWPKAAGVVMQADLGSRTQRHGRHAPTTEYYADISYTYQVNDRRYVAQRISLVNFDLADETGAAARAFLADHPARSTLDVYYDSQHPESAILIPEVDESGRAWTRYSGLALILVATWILMRSRKPGPGPGRKPGQHEIA
jgi:hypothetical protein